MILKNKLGKLKGQFLINKNYYKLLLTSAFVAPTNKQIYVDISQLAINRYLYSFLKMLSLQGYTVYVPKNKDLMAELNSGKSGEALFKSWMLNEGWLKFGIPSHRSAIFLKSDTLSNDYYTAFFNNDFKDSEYHLPMCKYPAHYRNIWKKEFKDAKNRKNSIFMIGNINQKDYDQIDSSRFFNVISRYKIYEWLKLQPSFLDLNGYEELKNFIEGNEDQRLICIDTSSKFQITGEDLPTILNEFRFYLALPGIIVPNSHNLIEGMASGCIPVIQSSYAELLRPKLRHNINAIIFEDLDDLKLKITRIFEIKDKDVYRLQKNVKLFYNSYFSSEAIVRTLEKRKFEKIFIQAEWISLQQYERRRNK